MRHQNSDKFQFKFPAMPSPEVVVGVRESLMLPVNSLLKMLAMLKSTAEYNRRAAIIQIFALDAQATKIIRFFRYSRSIVYDIMAKYMSFISPMKIPVCQWGRVTQKNASWGPPQSLKRLELIFDDPGQSLHVLMDVMKWMKIVAFGRSYIFQQDGALAHTVILFKIGSQTTSIFGPRNSGLPIDLNLNPL